MLLNDECYIDYETDGMERGSRKSEKASWVRWHLLLKCEQRRGAAWPGRREARETRKATLLRCLGQGRCFAVQAAITGNQSCLVLSAGG